MLVIKKEPKMQKSEVELSNLLCSSISTYDDVFKKILQYFSVDIENRKGLDLFGYFGNDKRREIFFLFPSLSGQFQRKILRGLVIDLKKVENVVCEYKSNVNHTNYFLMIRKIAEISRRKLKSLTLDFGIFRVSKGFGRIELPCLKNLEISGFGPTLEKKISEINAKRLKRLKLTNCNYLSVIVGSKTREICLRNVRILEYPFNLFLNPKLRVIRVRNLQIVDFNNEPLPFGKNHYYQNKNNTIKKFSSLRTLTLANNDDEFFKLNSFKSLEHLYIFQKKEKERINIYNKAISGVNLFSFPLLTTLTLSELVFKKEKMFQETELFPKLTRIRISRCQGIRGMNWNKDLRKRIIDLKILDSPEFNLVSFFSSSNPYLEDLRCLAIGRTKNYNSTGRCSERIVNIPGVKCLRRLYLMGLPISDEFFENSFSKDLCDLVLINCPNITGTGWMTSVFMQRLYVLDCRNFDRKKVRYYVDMKNMLEQKGIKKMSVGVFGRVVKNQPIKISRFLRETEVFVKAHFGKEIVVSKSSDLEEMIEKLCRERERKIMKYSIRKGRKQNRNECIENVCCCDDGDGGCTIL